MWTKAKRGFKSWIVVYISFAAALVAATGKAPAGADAAPPPELFSTDQVFFESTLGLKPRSDI